MFSIENRARQPAKGALGKSEYVMLGVCFQGIDNLSYIAICLTECFTYPGIGNTALCSPRRVMNAVYS
jgi:hypothetical protein